MAVMIKAGRASRRIALFFTAVTALLGLSIPPAASDGGAKNIVLAFNEADGSHLPRSGVKVGPAAGPTRRA